MAKDRPTELKTADEKFTALCDWSVKSIPGLGKAKAKPERDPEESIAEPCDCEHTNHGLHWKPARRTKDWEDE